MKANVISANGPESVAVLTMIVSRRRVLLGLLMLAMGVVVGRL
jgi:hypothetical protein